MMMAGPEIARIIIELSVKHSQKSTHHEEIPSIQSSFATHGTNV